VSLTPAAAPATAAYAAVVVEIQSAVNGEIAFVDCVYLGATNPGGGGSQKPGGNVYGNLLLGDSANWEYLGDVSQDWVSLDTNTTITRRASFAYGGSIGTVVPRTGNCCLHVMMGYGGNPNLAPVGVSEIQSPTVAVSAGATYTGSVWIRPSQTRNFQVFLDWYDVAGDLISSSAGTDTSMTSGTYAQNSATGVAPALAVEVAIRVRCSMFNNEVAFIDDATITQGNTLLTDVGGSMTPMLAQIQYSDDGGTTWLGDVRGASKVILDLADLSFVVSDYEAKPASSRTYRARFTDVDELNPTAWSSPNQSATPASTGDWWLKDLQTPTNNMKLFIDGSSDNGVNFDGPTTNAKFNTLGRPDPVIITDTYEYDVINFKSLLFAADYAAFEKLRQSNKVLLLQSDYGPEWYVAFDQRKRVLLNTNTEFQALDVTLFSTGRPSV